MTDALTPAEKAQKEVDKVIDANAKLREEIAQAEIDLASQVQLDSLAQGKELADRENERLKAQLASMRAQVKAQASSLTPTEQADAAAQEAVAAQTPVTPDIKDKE